MMPRTTPEIIPSTTIGELPSPDLYVRTYTTLLRSSGEVRVQSLEASHMRMQSSLHPYAGQDVPDTGALIYAMQRLPRCIARVRSVILGQEGDQFRVVLGDEVTSWERVEAPARRRAWRWNGDTTLTVHASSSSDIDDVLPCLVAYQIEWNKLHRAFNITELPTAPDEPHHTTPTATDPGDRFQFHLREGLASLGLRLRISPEDWVRLMEIWGDDFVEWLTAIATAPKDMVVRLLGGSDVAYTRLVRRWWHPISEALLAHGLERRPVYFISSNMHAVVNLLSGYVRRRQRQLLDFVGDEQQPNLPGSEIDALRSIRRIGSIENVLYYASRLWHNAHRDEEVRIVRREEEAARGIRHVDAKGGFDVGAQIIELNRIDPQDIDSRLVVDLESLRLSDAIVINVDYPLGLASYQIVREVATIAADLRGIYAIGKAATLNAAVGDVLLSETVFDEHSRNVYAFPNAFTVGSLAPFLERASALDNQTAVTVRGTFLQNHTSLERYYGERFTVVEMEAGPILSAIYEATRPERHPSGERVLFRELPFDLGIIHYASDTPYTQARTLGSRRLLVEGIDATYGSALAVMQRIMNLETARHGRGAKGFIGDIAPSVATSEPRFSQRRRTP